MAAKTSLILILLCLAARFGMAEEVVIPIMIGDLFADGRPVKKTIEIRLEGQDRSFVANAYTLGTTRFTFRDFSINLEQNYSLLVREPGYKELRYQINMNDFVQDSARRQTYHFAGIITLNLESLPVEKKNGGPKVVDARQLKAEISGEARRQFQLALDNIAAGKGNAAVENLEKAVELAPDFYDALNKLGVEYLKAGQYRKAEAALEKAQALNQNDPLPLTNLGILYLQEGQKFSLSAKKDAASDPGEVSFRKAAEMFEKALRLDSLAPLANFRLGNALYELGEYDKAESLLLHTLDLDSRMNEARLLLISIYTNQKRYETALQEISAFLEASPNSPEKKRLETLKAQIENVLKP